MPTNHTSSTTRRHLLVLAIIPTTILAVAACSADSGTGPGSAARSVSFSVSTASSGAAFASGLSFAAAPTPAGFVVVSGKDTLKIDSVRMVLAHVKLWAANDTTCGESEHADSLEHDCEPLRSGPMLVNLPLDTGTKQVFSVPVPKGSYEGIFLQVHKPSSEDGDTATAAFLTAHPDWANVSVRVDGTFDGKPVHWQGSPVVPIRERFNPPVVVSDTSGMNFTLHVDVGTWFINRDGSLIDPSLATGDTAELITHNIQRSLHAFDDDRREGRDDHHHDSGGN